MISPDAFQLTLEQQFTLKRIEAEAPKLSSEEKDALLISVTKLLMAKDNVIRSLVRENLSQGCGL